uniref:O-antigen ligase family protein n=1 Tax=Acetatifactor sp. TaxID=1872090 RepID=UPI004055F97C
MSSKLKKNKKQEESLSTAVKQFLAYVLDGMICLYMLLIIVVMPFYNEQGYTYIGTNKAMFFRNASVNAAKFIIPTLVIYLIFWGVEKAKNHSKMQKRLSITDKFALLYGGSLLLSYAFSDYKEMALWGSDGWYMGLLPQLFLLGIYFLISRFWKPRKWMFLLFLPVSAVVFALGYLNRFGIYPIDMKAYNELFLSTIGNINWYCGYIVSVFFGGYYLLWQSVGQEKTAAEGKAEFVGTNKNAGVLQGLTKILLVAYVAIGFATLVTQGSLSGLVALAVMFVVTFCISTNDSSKMLGFWVGTLILSLVCTITWFLRNLFHWEITFEDSFVELLTNSKFPFVAFLISLIFTIGIMYCNTHNKYPTRFFKCLKWIVGGGAVAGVCVIVGMIVVNTLHPGSIGALSENPFFVFTPEWGSNRGATWKAGWMCFTEQNLLHKLIGVGPDAMEGFTAQNGSAELINLIAERFSTNRLTNAHCEWLTVLVNIGLLGFVSFAGMMVSAIAQYLKAGRYNAIIGACGICLLAYTVNNMFSFQQSMSVATIFIIFGIGEAYAENEASQAHKVIS